MGFTMLMLDWLQGSRSVFLFYWRKTWTPMDACQPVNADLSLPSCPQYEIGGMPIASSAGHRSSQLIFFAKYFLNILCRTRESRIQFERFSVKLKRSVAVANIKHDLRKAVPGVGGVGE